MLKKIPKDHLSKINVIDVSKNCPFFPKTVTEETYEFPITKYMMELIPYLLIFIHLM